MPANYASVANLEIAPDQMPVMEATFPAAPVPPVAPAPAVTPAAVAPSRSNNWPSVFMSKEDIRANGGEIIDLHAPVESRQHKGMMVERAMVRLKFGGAWIQGMAYTSTKRDAAGNVIGYHTIAECSSVQIAQDPNMPGRYSFKLTPTGISPELLAKATVAKMADGINWAQFQVVTGANLTQA